MRRFKPIDPESVQYLRPGDQVLVGANDFQPSFSPLSPKRTSRERTGMSASERENMMKELHRMADISARLREESRGHSTQSNSEPSISPSDSISSSLNDLSSLDLHHDNVEIQEDPIQDDFSSLERTAQIFEQLSQTFKSECARVSPWNHRSMKSMRHPHIPSAVRQFTGSTCEAESEWSHLTSERKWAHLQNIFELLMESETMDGKRDVVMQDLDFCNAVRHWWNNAIKNEDSMMNKKSYFYMNVKIYEHLVTNSLMSCAQGSILLFGDDWDALESVEADWIVDTLEENMADHISFESFYESMFELADNWTTTHDPQEYTEFLIQLFNQVYRPDDLYLDIRSLMQRIRIPSLRESKPKVSRSRVQEYAIKTRNSTNSQKNNVSESMGSFQKGQEKNDHLPALMHGSSITSSSFDMYGGYQSDRHGTRLSCHPSDQYFPTLAAGQVSGKLESWSERQQNMIGYYVPLTHHRLDYFEQPWLSSKHRALRDLARVRSSQELIHRTIEHHMDHMATVLDEQRGRTATSSKRSREGNSTRQPIESIFRTYRISREIGLRNGQFSSEIQKRRQRRSSERVKETESRAPVPILAHTRASRYKSTL